MLAEEGDDLSSISVPSDLGPEGSGASPSASGSSSAAPETKPSEEAESSEKQETASSKPAETVQPKKTSHKTIKHSKPLFPSVLRL